MKFVFIFCAAWVGLAVLFGGKRWQFPQKVSQCILHEREWRAQNPQKGNLN